MTGRRWPRWSPSSAWPIASWSPNPVGRLGPPRCGQPRRCRPGALLGIPPGRWPADVRRALGPLAAGAGRAGPAAARPDRIRHVPRSASWSGAGWVPGLAAAGRAGRRRCVLAGPRRVAAGRRCPPAWWPAARAPARWPRRLRVLRPRRRSCRLGCPGADRRDVHAGRGAACGDRRRRRADPHRGRRRRAERSPAAGRSDHGRLRRGGSGGAGAVPAHGRPRSCSGRSLRCPRSSDRPPPETSCSVTLVVDQPALDRRAARHRRAGLRHGGRGRRQGADPCDREMGLARRPGRPRPARAATVLRPGRRASQPPGDRSGARWRMHRCCSACRSSAALWSTRPSRRWPLGPTLAATAGDPAARRPARPAGLIGSDAGRHRAGRGGGGCPRTAAGLLSA